jgi:Fe-S-cluster containining protein
MDDFKCRKCAKCCSNILPLLDNEIRLLKKLRKKENIQVLNQNWYAICPFLNSNNRCDIYENRPLICREYTCYKQNNNIFDIKVFENHKPQDFKAVDLRKEIFKRKEK